MSDGFGTATVAVSDGTVETFHLGHRPGLDGLRGVAILFVLGTHTAYLWSGMSWHLRGGYIGVDIFFVLSGFLITSLLIEEFDRHSRVSLRSFYLRRACRLLPALYLVLLTAFIFSQVVPVIAATAPLRHEFIGTGSIILYVGNWYQIYRPSAWGVGQTWSLAIEEQFYLVWPIVLITLLKIGRRTIMLGFVSLVIVASTILSAITYTTNGPASLTAYLATDCRLSGIMLGAGVSILLHRGWRPGRWILPAACVGAIFLLVELNLTGPNFGVAPWQYDGGFAVVGLAACFVLLASLDSASVFGKILSFSVLRFFGRISYSLYLWHYPIVFAADALYPLPADAPWRVAIVWPMAVAVATCSYYLVERPVMGFARRWKGPDPKTRSRAALAAS